MLIFRDRHDFQRFFELIIKYEKNLTLDELKYKIIETKNAIMEFLNNSGIECEDMGPFEYDSLDDYPDFIIPCALKVAQNPDLHR